VQLSDIMDMVEAFVDSRAVIMRNGLEEVVVKGARTVAGIGVTRVVFLANAEMLLRGCRREIWQWSLEYCVCV
jgi:hypothetical protein